MLSAEQLGSGLTRLREAAGESVSGARLRATILMRLAPREGYSGAGYVEAARIAREAVRLAEEVADEHVLATAIASLGHLELLRGRRFPHALMQRAESLEAAVGLTVDGPTEVYAEMLAICGEQAAACERLERIVSLGRRDRADSGVCGAIYRLAYSEWERGDWDRAWSLGLEAQELAGPERPRDAGAAGRRRSSRWWRRCAGASKQGGPALSELSRRRTEGAATPADREARWLSSSSPASDTKRRIGSSTLF